jgi:hypothetical protein
MKHYEIPAEILKEPEHIPEFWISTVEGVNQFLDTYIKKGQVRTIGTSAGGRPVRAVFYGEGRRGRGTSTLSGCLFINKKEAYYGRDYEKKVLLGFAGTHGAEFEGIVGMVNLLSVLETGKDLRGRECPGIVRFSEGIDRIIIIPVLNIDGRQRVPVNMPPFLGESHFAHDYFNIGAWNDGKLIGWPACKEYIPLDFDKTMFPGGYPNDAGVNIMHDDFFGARQPETQALLELTAAEKPDIILDAHTGVSDNDYFLLMHKAFMVPNLDKAFDGLFTQVHTGLALSGLQSTGDPEIEADPRRTAIGSYNLDTVLNLNCGALIALYENPSCSYCGRNRKGETVIQIPDMILDGQLVVYREAFRYLVETGGICKWMA